MNPFKVLGALPTDSRQRLQALLEDAALLNRQEAADEAYAALIRPGKRLEAEMSWYPEKESQTDRPLWKLNRLVEQVARTGNRDAVLVKACELWGAQSEEELLSAINDDRAQGGWKPVQLGEMREAVKEYLNGIAARLDELYLYDATAEERVRKLSAIKANEIRASEQKKLFSRHARALLNLIDRYASGKQGFAGNELVETLVSRYELRYAGQVEQLRADILEITSQRRQNAPFRWWPPELLRMVDEWSTLTMPRRKLTHARGMRSIPSEELADEIRLFMAELYNRFNDSLNAKQLIYKLRKCFPEYEWLQQQLKEDEGVILNAEKLRKLKAKKAREKKLMPLGILCIILAIILNRCSPEEPERIRVPAGVTLPSEDTLRQARIYLTNDNLREKREAIEAKEKEIQMAFALGGDVDIETLNAELMQLKSEYAALKLSIEQMMKEMKND